MKAPILKTHKIGVLRDPLLHDHKFAIPKLQRNFVWDAGRAAKLDRKSTRLNSSH